MRRPSRSKPAPRASGKQRVCRYPASARLLEFWDGFWNASVPCVLLPSEGKGEGEGEGKDGSGRGRNVVLGWPRYSGCCVYEGVGYAYGDRAMLSCEDRAM